MHGGQRCRGGLGDLLEVQLLDLVEDEHDALVVGQAVEHAIEAGELLVLGGPLLGITPVRAGIGDLGRVRVGDRRIPSAAGRAAVLRRLPGADTVDPGPQTLALDLVEAAMNHQEDLLEDVVQLSRPDPEPSQESRGVGNVLVEDGAKRPIAGAVAEPGSKRRKQEHAPSMAATPRDSDAIDSGGQRARPTASAASSCAPTAPGS